MRRINSIHYNPRQKKNTNFSHYKLGPYSSLPYIDKNNYNKTFIF